MSLEDAFYEVCDEAEPAESLERYVSLYSTGQVYGGPEEGGWWRSITTLEATQRCCSQQEAEAKFQRVVAMTHQLNLDARQQHGRHCQSQLDACGGDGDVAQLVFGEVDGPTKYFCVVEENAGSREHADSAGYE